MRSNLETLEKHPDEGPSSNANDTNSNLYHEGCSELRFQLYDIKLIHINLTLCRITPKA
jgi:hypothetical protein